VLLLGVDQRCWTVIGGIVIGAQWLVGLGDLVFLALLPLAAYLRHRTTLRPLVHAACTSQGVCLVLEDRATRLTTILAERQHPQAKLYIETPLTAGHLLQRYALKRICERAGIPVLFGDGDSVCLQWIPVQSSGDI
jgi:hypothetical protein